MAPGSEAASLVTTGRALVATQNWTFLIGQGLMPGINALLLGSVTQKVLTHSSVPVLVIRGEA